MGGRGRGEGRREQKREREREDRTEEDRLGISEGNINKYTEVPTRIE